MCLVGFVSCRGKYVSNVFIYFTNVCEEERSLNGKVGNKQKGECVS